VWPLLHRGNCCTGESVAGELLGVGLRPDLACRWSAAPPAGGFCGMMVHFGKLVRKQALMRPKRGEPWLPAPPYSVFFTS
jgi:hypothetical protein